MTDAFKDAFQGKSSGFNFLYDINLAGTAIYVCIGLSLVLNVLYIYFMSSYPEFLAKVAVVAINIIFLGGAGASVFFGMKNKDASYGLYASAFVCVFFLLIFDCMLYYRYKHFKVAIAVIDAAADFFAATKRLMLVSLVYGLLGFIALVACVAGCFFVLTLNPMTIT